MSLLCFHYRVCLSYYYSSAALFRYPLSALGLLCAFLGITSRVVLRLQWVLSDNNDTLVCETVAPTVPMANTVEIMHWQRVHSSSPSSISSSSSS